MKNVMLQRIFIFCMPVWY